ncbi:MAG: helix-turn-helix transcriptional regulator [Desulfovibrio sp.]|jgi:DNA-binding Xre family transcriptional regulator|nr:helix-turn-helix transcriptional regulator [Desulfovibrio sp.]
MLTSNVKEIMEKQGVTIRAMAEKTGLSDVTILRARRKHIAQCRLSTLEIIAKCLGCKVKDLFEEDLGPAGPEIYHA